MENGFNAQYGNADLTQSAPKKKGFKILVTVLLIVNLLFSTLLLGITLFNETEIGDVQSVVKENRAYTQYHRELGEKSFRIHNERTRESTYGSNYIIGTIENTSRKNFESVSIAYKLFEDGECVDVVFDYLYCIDAGDEREFELSIYDTEFDNYELLYISATE